MACNEMIFQKVIPHWKTIEVTRRLLIKRLSKDVTFITFVISTVIMYVSVLEKNISKVFFTFITFQQHYSMNTTITDETYVHPKRPLCSIAKRGKTTTYFTIMLSGVPQISSAQ
jgi:hypothetical protein